MNKYAFAFLGAAVGLAIGSIGTYVFVAKPPLSAAAPNSDILQDKPITMFDVQMSAFEKWHRQGYLMDVKASDPRDGKSVPGEPGCKEYSYKMTSLVEQELAIAKITICGKKFNIGNPKTLKSILSDLKGSGK